MVVFNPVSDRFPDVAIDIFTNEPFQFESEYVQAETKEVAPHIRARVVSVPTLIALKKVADRDQDRIDINKLRKLYPLT